MPYVSQAGNSCNSSKRKIRGHLGETSGVDCSVPVESLTDSVSKLDLKAPGQARREYEKALRALYEKSFANAVESLTKSIVIYPNFVAAHNALGSAYLDLGQNDRHKKNSRRPSHWTIICLIPFSTWAGLSLRSKTIRVRNSPCKRHRRSPPSICICSRL